MMLSVIVLSFLSLLSHFVASAPTTSSTAIRGGGVLSPRSLPCAIPYLSEWIGCDSSSIPAIIGGFGTARGVRVGDAYRFVVQYATADRFKNPVRASKWKILNNDPAALPPACPQNGMSSSEYSEQCLYAVIYVPEKCLTKVDWELSPVYVWLHGGSFISGSATNPGLDGSKLAVATNSIVVVMQYRLGVFGYLPPSGTEGASGNLGVKDAIAGLEFIKKTVFWLGGNPLSVVVSGHSSGGHLTRALLASPSASDLFDGVTLFADPVNYGFLKKPVYQALQTAFWSNNSPTASVSSLLAAQADFYTTGGPAVDPSVGIAEPLRPTQDGTLITVGLTTSYPSKKKPIWTTSNQFDGGSAIGGIPQGVLWPQWYTDFITDNLGETRAQIFLNSPYYNPLNNAELSEPYSESSYDVILQGVERGATDHPFRCANWDLARRWASQGGKAWSGLFELGATYPTNEGFEFCTSGSGRTCHEDEIFIVFGTTPSPTAAQTALTTEIQARLKSFIWNPSGGPNASGYANWQPAIVSSARTLRLGGPSAGTLAEEGGCVPGFWGTTLGGQLAFDWEYYNE